MSLRALLAADFVWKPSDPSMMSDLPSGFVAATLFRFRKSPRFYARREILDAIGKLEALNLKLWNSLH
jgi:hypothetical protein